MLAGLPVVSTPSQGGRDVYFDPDYCLICEPNPAAVRDAVQAMKARKLSHEYIRARTLAKIVSQRRLFLTLLDDLIESLGGHRHFGLQWPFAQTRGIVAWDSYANHLAAFGFSSRRDRTRRRVR